MSGAPDDGRPSGGLRKAVASGAGHLLLRQGVSLLLKFAGLMLITRILGPEKYGAFVAGSQIYLWLMLVLCGGISVHLVRTAETSESLRRTAYAVLAGIAAAVSALLAASAGILDRVTNVPGAGSVAAILALAAPFQLITIPAMAQLERAMRFDVVSRIEMAAQVGYYAVAIALVGSGVGPAGLAIALVVQQAATCALAHARAGARPAFGFSRTEASAIWRTASAHSTAVFLWNGRNLVLPFAVGPILGANAVGIVGMTIGLCDMLTVLKTIAWRLSLAALRHIRDDVARLREAVREGTELQMLLLGAVLIAFGWLGHAIVPLLFGARWLPVMDLYPLVALGYFTNAVFNMHSSVLTLLGRTRDVVIFSGLHLILFAASAWLLLPWLGLIGYGLAEIAAFPAYAYLAHRSAAAIGAPQLRLAALWWAGAAAALLWKWTGLVGLVAPFAVLAAPVSIQRLGALAGRFRGGRQTSAAQPSGPRRFLFLRSEKPETDFRLALAHELKSIGHDVTYVYLRRRPLIVDPSDPERRRSMSLPALLLHLVRTYGRRDGLIVWNSTNLTFPGMSLTIRALIGGFWIFDLHDDLVYGATGWRRAWKERLLKVLSRAADATVAVSPLLTERVPGAIHLGNASDLPRLPRSTYDGRKALILASIDDRFDFDFLRKVATLEPGVEFVVHGHVSSNADSYRDQLVALLRAAPNVKHAGGYANIDLPWIMRSYDVTIAPYVAVSPATRYIDPLRYHHCLRSGMELITTGIPAAAFVADRAHVVASPEEAAAVLRGLSSGRIQRRNGEGAPPTYGWRERAVELDALLDRLQHPAGAGTS